LAKSSVSHPSRPRVAKERQRAMKKSVQGNGSGWYRSPAPPRNARPGLNRRS
jgi:hypothetical protein